MPYKYVFNGRSVVRRQVDMKKAAPKVVQEPVKEGSEQAGKGAQLPAAPNPKVDKAKIRAALFESL